MSMMLDLLDRPIAYHRCFVALTGSVSAALILSQAVYWQRRCQKGRGGWWWKTAREWDAETGIKKDALANARKSLRRHDFWGEKREGLPARTWYRVDSGMLEKALKIQFAGFPQTGCSDSSKLDEAGPINNSEGIQKTTKTSTETSSEISTTTGGSDGASAENKNPETKIVFSKIIPLGERDGLIRKLSPLRKNQRADILDTIAHKIERAAAGKSEPIADIQAYTVGLIRKAKDNALDLPRKVVAERQSTELSQRLDAIRQGIDDGGFIYINGDPASLAVWPIIEIGNGHANIAALIKRGEKVEIRRPTNCMLHYPTISWL